MAHTVRVNVKEVENSIKFDLWRFHFHHLKSPKERDRGKEMEADPIIEKINCL